MPRSADQSPLHPIRVVARRTGLAPAVIRAWESRYGAIEPHRTANGERLYSDSEVERLHKLKGATDAGRRISQVADLDDADLDDLLAADTEAAGGHDAEVSQATAVLGALEPAALAAVLEDLARSLGPGRLARDVLRPVLANLEARPANPDSRRLLLAPHWQQRLKGTTQLEDLAAVREAVAELGRPTGVSAGQVHALLLVQEVLHHLLATLHDQLGGDNLVATALAFLEQRFGNDRVSGTLRRFEELWQLEASTPVEQPLVVTLVSTTTEVSPPPAASRERSFELLLLLWLANRNPAFASLRELLDDSELERETGYRELVGSLDELFAARAQPIAELFDPATGAGDSSPQGTLADLLERHGDDLGGLGDRLRVGLGVLAEENRLPFAPPPPPAPAAAGPPGPPPRRSLAPDELPPEMWRLSHDSEWMTRATLVAKHTLVWLDQLSRRFGKPIVRLDEIPDEALAELRGHGFDSLWLVGLWERSPASQTLGREAGRLDAAASAYAVRNYEIATSLGGWEALDDLAGRCREIGLVLGCDLVPNHTAIDSDWVIERPELFVQTPRPPFPNYQFTGADLSPDPRVELRLEDGYATGTDAAVVFERREVASGRVAYLYHGNDGTGLPWKDTAQLDYTRADVRTIMTKQIVTLAGHFSMIRFDAAMTLTRRHFQRLWYPVPGSGGAIPSRAERGLSAKAFDALMPREFWSGVVDAVAASSPETMLVAEAFWLMEPYFVRQLGINRVYHSAFMHALGSGRPEELRQWIVDCLGREPAELSRYVHFLTTPDERAAAATFGTNERYLAAATLLATLPGLPLFGHGQVEGLHEKYGMEFSRAETEETADLDAVERHRVAVAPLLAERELFADPANLELLVVKVDGHEVGDIWAYSNRSADTAVLVVVNFAERTARVRLGPTEVVRVPWGHRRKSLTEALGHPGAETIAATHFFDGSTTELAVDARGFLLLDVEPWARQVWRIPVSAAELPGFPSAEIPAEPDLATELADPQEPEDAPQPAEPPHPDPLAASPIVETPAEEPAATTPKPAEPRNAE